MNIRNKILSAIGLGVILTIAYYYIYSYFQIWFEDLCQKNYCIEFFPIGDFIACYIAIVGLYFVVTSLDAWKHQDQYQTAKQNIKLLHKISEELTSFNVKISKVRDFKKEILFLNTQFKKEIMNTELFLRYKNLMEDLEIIPFVNDTVYKITQMEQGLYQNEFNTIINLAHSYVTNIDSEITEKNAEIIKKYQENIVQNELDKKQQLAEAENIEDDNLRKKAIISINFNQYENPVKILDLTQNQINSIVLKKSFDYHNFSIKLKNLQDKLNKYTD